MFHGRWNLILTINEIINGNYKVTEKQNLLTDYRDRVNKQINDAIEAIKKGYKYCPQCKEYYKENAWEKENKIEMREICTYTDPVQWSENEYENKKCSVVYDVCPMGHMIEENIVY